MAMDQPVTVYPGSSKSKEVEHTKEELDAVADEWAKNHSSDDIRGKEVSLSELFGEGWRKRHQQDNNK